MLSSKYYLFSDIMEKITLSLRGATAGHILIKLDGKWINDPWNEKVDLSLIPLDHSGRIKIVRGGASKSYTADIFYDYTHIRSQYIGKPIGVIIR